MTHFDIVYTHFGTVHTLLASYERVHTHFNIVNAHFGTVHTLFTSYDTVHTHTLKQFKYTLAQLTHCSQAITQFTRTLT